MHDDHHHPGHHHPGHHDHDHGHHHHDDDGHHHHGPGHNHGDPRHLHSHVHGAGDREKAEELQVLMTSFLDGFRAAEDKNSFLRIAGIPFHKEGPDGLTMHLVDAAITSNWQIGTASPAFASRELVYLPYPGKMIAERETMTFTYVSLTHREDVGLQDVLKVAS